MKMTLKIALQSIFMPWPASLARAISLKTQSFLVIFQNIVSEVVNFLLQALPAKASETIQVSNGIPYARCDLGFTLREGLFNPIIHIRTWS